MSLIYPKKASLPLRLHCQPVLVEDTTTTTAATAAGSRPGTGAVTGAGLKAGDSGFGTSSSSTAAAGGGGSHDKTGAGAAGVAGVAGECEKAPRVMRWSLTEEDALFVDFVACLLHLDPRERLTATEALMHPWLDEAREGRIDLKVGGAAMMMMMMMIVVVIVAVIVAVVVFVVVVIVIVIVVFVHLYTHCLPAQGAERRF